MTPPKKYLLHDREIPYVLFVGHFESFYYVMYIFGFVDWCLILSIFFTYAVRPPNTDDLEQSSP